MTNDKPKKTKKSTISALLNEKPKRGRPKHDVSRQNVYVALTKAQKQKLKQLAAALSKTIVRADIPDIAVSALAARLEGLRRAVAGRNREMPEGITDLESLYLLWDLPIPDNQNGDKWTSIRLSPQQVIDLGRLHGMLNALYSTTRSQAFVLGLAVLEQAIVDDDSLATFSNPQSLITHIQNHYAR